MKDKCFLDTNLLVYLYDENEIEKQKSVITFLKSLRKKQQAVLSVQTLGEFFNVTTKKLKISKEQSMFFCNEIRHMYPVYEISTENVFHAMQISKTTNFSYWDSLIIAMAIDTDCSVLYSEDLNPGQQVEGVRIINPFTSAGN